MSNPSVKPQTRAVIKNLEHIPPNGVRTTIIRWKVTDEENKILEDLYKMIPHGEGNNTWVAALRMGAQVILERLQQTEPQPSAPALHENPPPPVKTGQRPARPMSNAASSVLGQLQPDQGKK